jgi:hypothetical protein
MPSWIDGALYPDTDVPEELDTLADRVDFLVRLCGAWDFGILPERATVEEIRRLDWREAVDAARLLTSPVYHLVRSWHGLAPFLGQTLSYISDDPSLAFI